MVKADPPPRVLATATLDDGATIQVVITAEGRAQAGATMIPCSRLASPYGPCELDEGHTGRCGVLLAIPAPAPAAYEAVDHPHHYNASPSGVEAITVCEHMPFNVGTAVKYLFRLGEKPGADPVEDIRKAIWYLNRECERLAKAKR